ncbi:MAG: hypothetical protein Fur0023_20420 [Bacteroidia bacterium]
MKRNHTLHIVSFDIPYPPDYGGVVDVFYKIKYLHQAGFEIILHCFQYNNKPVAEELEKYCKRVYYYRRDTSLDKHLHLLPYTVTSRINKELLNNLIKDDHPILFETLHTAYFINHPLLKNRKKILRLSNIEHHYYYHLFLSEKNIFKKLYFLLESIKLYFYEKQTFRYADLILPVTQNDVNYINKYYARANVYLVPSFHPFKDIFVWKGKGEYLLYHGNLSVPENYKAAEYLLKNIAPQISIPIIIAGKNPPKFLVKKCQKYKNVQLVANPDDDEMKQLIQNAHIVWLFTHQDTGLKLKLIHSLFTARFIVCNSKMIAGTPLKSNLSFYIKDTPQEMINTIQALQQSEFDDGHINQRKDLIQWFDNIEQIGKLREIIVGL